MKVLIIDANYNFNKNNEPVIRLFGKKIGDFDEGKDVVVHVFNFEPYIYIGDCGLDIFELKKRIEELCKGYIKSVEIVKRFKPIGYQIEKSNFLRLVLFTPKIVQELKKILKEGIEELTDSEFFEADIPYRNRYLIDYDINGMDIILFNESGKKINNYGLNCSELYVCNLSDIKVLKDEIVNIEY